MTRPVRKRPKSESAPLEQRIFLAYCEKNGLPTPTPEFQFAKPDRKWRFDFAFCDCGVALEIEGAVWTQGRHTRGSGFVADMEKYNAAALRGWAVYRVTPDQLYSPETLALLRAALSRKESA